ncbi:Copper transport protein [Yarrowia sp. C11]|nr:Copper transport protein [Yarrowia sp. C11]KAG5370461.1 Copper transport protein [Yarrowia sp. E02]
MMDHSGHEMPMPDMPGHGDMPEMCSMNMIFNWDTKGMCVVFPWWHVKTHVGMVLTVVAVVFISAGYEYVRKLSRDIDAAFKATDCDLEPLINPDVRPSDQKKIKIYKSIFYGFQVGYSFLLMLVFMTYNAWLMAAVAIGAGVGYFIWGGESSERSMSCH